MSITPISASVILTLTEPISTPSDLHQAHARLLKTGLIHHPPTLTRLLTSALSSTHPPTLCYAHSLFSVIPTPSSFAYNTLIRAHARSDNPLPAFHLFIQMLHSHTRPDNFTFPFLLKACASLRAFNESLQLHARILKSGFGSDIFVLNTLIHTYATIGRIEDALKVFDRMAHRDFVSSNAIIGVYVQNARIREARELFDEMPERSVETWNFMISGYVNCGLLDHARELFDEMPKRDVVSWNAMLTGCARAGLATEVMELFQAMLNENLVPDECTLVNVLSSCSRLGALGQGEWVHAYIDKNGIEIKGFLSTALVDMYSKCGSIDKALQVFYSTTKKDVSTWNAVIEGLSSHGYGKRGLELFETMERSGLKPNAVTFVSVLSACSHAGLLKEGRRIFDLMSRVYRIEPKIEHYGCMVDLYGRAGLLERAEDVIARVAVGDKVVLWESLLSACRNSGDVKLAELAARRLNELNPRDSACYVQLSNVYALARRWSDVRRVREEMSARGVRKEPGCSTIEVDGIVHEFFCR